MTINRKLQHSSLILGLAPCGHDYITVKRCC